MNIGNTNNCPVCNLQAKITDQYPHRIQLVECKKCGSFYITDDLIDDKFKIPKIKDGKDNSVSYDIQKLEAFMYYNPLKSQRYFLETENDFSNF